MRFPRRLAAVAAGTLCLAAGVVGISSTTPPAGASSAPASTATSTASSTPVSATADTYTDASQPTKNYGTAKTLTVDGSPVRRAWLKFTLSALPTSASLKVYAGTSSAQGLTVNAAPAGWTENGLTAANAPALGTQVGTASTTAGGTYLTIPLNVAALTSGANTLVVSRTSTGKVALSSRESTHPPTLTVTYGTTSPTTPPTSSPAPTSAAVSKLLVFVEENHSLNEMKSGMPYTFGLAQQYGYATAYKAITHPSLPNYLAITGGQTYGVSDDNPPSSHSIPGSSVFGQAIAAGRTAKTYADSMTTTCQQGSSGSYAVKHNPWAYYTATAERTGCSSFDVPVGELATDAAAGTLPNVGMVVPNLCNDAHDCSLATADNWFKSQMQNVFAGPDWKSGHLAVVLTADEDDSSQSNTVLTVVIHPSQNGNVVTTPLTHYSLTRLYEQVGHASSFLNGAATAPDLASAFHLPIQ